MNVHAVEYDNTDRHKVVRSFHYNSTTVDAAEGQVCEVDYSISTYGYGKACKLGTTSPTVGVIGIFDEAVDASALDRPFRMVNVIVAGVATTAYSDNSTTQGVLQMCSTGTAGSCTDVTVGNEHYGFAVALGADDSGARIPNGLYVLPRWGEM